MLESCGERAIGRAAHALLQGILLLSHSAPGLHWYSLLRPPNIKSAIMNSNAAVSLMS